MLWASDAIDGIADLDVAIGIAIGRAMEDPAGGARVQVTTPAVGGRRSRWADRVVFVASHDEASLRRYR